MGARNGPLSNLIPIPMRFYQTQMGVYDKETEQDGWCKITIDLDQVEAVRPFINDDNRYEYTHLYFKSGLECMVREDYDEFVKTWMSK